MSSPATLVVDVGSLYTRIGFSGQTSPQEIVFTSKQQEEQQKSKSNHHHHHHHSFPIGEHDSNDGMLKNGIIQNWDKFENYFENVIISKANRIRKLSSSSSSVELSLETTFPVLLTEHLHNSLDKKIKILQLLFEKFSVQSAFLAHSGTLALYSTGRVDGLIVESGESVSSVAVVAEGFAVPSLYSIFPIAGHHITQQVKSILNLKDQDTARELKERGSTRSSSVFSLPDGTTLSISQQQYLDAIQPMFKYPISNVYNNSKDIDGIGIQSIACDMIDQSGSILNESNLLKNIILSGGNTCIDTFDVQLTESVKKIWSLRRKEKSPRVMVTSAPFRTNAPWIGASILASLPTFREYPITLKEYKEKGEERIIRERLLILANKAKKTSNQLPSNTIHQQSSNDLKSPPSLKQGNSSSSVGAVLEVSTTKGMALTSDMEEKSLMSPTKRQRIMVFGFKDKIGKVISFPSSMKALLQTSSTLLGKSVSIALLKDYNAEILDIDTLASNDVLILLTKQEYDEYLNGLDHAS